MPSKKAAKSNISALPPPPKPRLAEIGAQSLLPYTWFANEEAYDYSRVSIQMLENMLDMDGQAQSVYRLVTMPLKAASLTLDPAKNGKEEADFINSIFFNPPNAGGLQIPWTKVIAQIARATLTGAEVLEQVYEIRGDMIYLTKLAPRPRTSLIFLRDRRGEFNGVKQQLPDGWQEIPLSNCFRFTINPEFNPMYGRSMFLPAYYHHEKKHKLYYTSHIAYAIQAAGIRKGRVPEVSSKDEKDTFKRALESIGFNTTIIVPEGFEMEVVYPTHTSDPMPLIDHHDNMMAKGVLGQVIEVGTGKGPGSFAVGSTHMDLWLMAEEAIMDEISEELTRQVIAPLIDWNFGTGNYPTVRLKANYQDRRSAIQAVFERISSAKQVNTTAEFWLEIEKAMAEELGFVDEINYDEKEQEFLSTFKQQQIDARAKPTPQLPGGAKPKPSNQPPSGGN